MISRFFTLFIVIAFLLLPTNVSAAYYNPADVSQHNTIDDCWMVFDNKVFGFPKEVVNDHKNQYLNIDEWCGDDMTKDFQTKADSGKDHNPDTYKMLEQYYIGQLIPENSQLIQTEYTKNHSSSYNIWPAILLPIFLYVLYLATTKIAPINKYKYTNRNMFDKVINTTLLFGLIPSAIMSILLLNEGRFNSIEDLNLDYLYWYVELSIAFSSILLIHLIIKSSQKIKKLESFRITKNSNSKKIKSRQRREKINN